MQQAREEESNTLMQLLSRQQMGSGSSVPFNGMNSSSGAFGSAQTNSHMSQSRMNNLDMNNMGGRDSLSNMNTTTLGSQMNNFMPSSFMNNRAMNMDGMNMNHQMNLNNIPPVASAASSSSSSQFKKAPDLSFDSQMSNLLSQSFMNNDQNSMNMGYLPQKSQLMQPQGVGVGMNNAFQKNNYMDMAGAATMPNAQQEPSSQEDPGWEEQYKSLLAYHLKFGHCKVPARFKANPKLGRWVMTQRRQFTLLMQGFPSALTAERIRKLETLGFTWSVRPEPVTTWNKKYHELKGYKANYGNCMVPQRYQANPQLGTWVHTQRRQYKLMSEGKKSSMTKEKADALDSIGFFWAAKNISSSSESSELPVDDSNNSDQGENNERAKAA